MAEEASQPWVAALGIVHQQDDLVQRSDDCYPADLNSFFSVFAIIELRDHYNFEVDLLCGATLVSSLSLLTAAHCVNNKKQASHFHLST